MPRVNKSHGSDWSKYVEYIPVVGSIVGKLKQAGEVGKDAGKKVQKHKDHKALLKHYEKSVHDRAQAGGVTGKHGKFRKLSDEQIQLLKAQEQRAVRGEKKADKRIQKEKVKGALRMGVVGAELALELTVDSTIGKKAVGLGKGALKGAFGPATGAAASALEKVAGKGAEKVLELAGHEASAVVESSISHAIDDEISEVVDQSIELALPTGVEEKESEKENIPPVNRLINTAKERAMGKAKGVAEDLLFDAIIHPGGQGGHHRERHAKHRYHH